MLKTEVIGNIGRDAVVVDIKGKDYTKFSVAHRPHKDAETVWVTVMYHGDSLAKWLKKGAGVYASGELSCGLYQTDGKHKIDITVWARDVQITKFAEGQDKPQDGEDLPF